MKENKHFKVTSNKTGIQCIQFYGDNCKVFLTSIHGRLDIIL